MCLFLFLFFFAFGVPLVLRTWVLAFRIAFLLLPLVCSFVLVIVIVAVAGLVAVAEPETVVLFLIRSYQATWKAGYTAYLLIVTFIKLIVKSLPSWLACFPYEYELWIVSWWPYRYPEWPLAISKGMWTPNYTMSTASFDIDPLQIRPLSDYCLLYYKFVWILLADFELVNTGLGLEQERINFSYRLLLTESHL